MGLGAVTLGSTALVLGMVIAFNKDYAVPPAVKLSVVLGLLLPFLLGTGFGACLSSQLSGHWVGGIRSGAGGLPIVKWSRTGGDLRVAHFFGIHAMHFIPAFGLTLHAMRIPPLQSRLAIWTFAVLHTVFSRVTFLQALRGQPFNVFQEAGLAARRVGAQLRLSHFALRPPGRGPVDVEELAAWRVGAFVGMRAKVVTLALQQVLRQHCAAVGVVIRQGGA